VGTGDEVIRRPLVDSGGLEVQRGMCRNSSATVSWCSVTSATAARSPA
jgi:hypothetical protein